MKNHLLFRAGIFFIAFALISGCTKTTEVTMVAPVSTGQIVGSVLLHEMDCSMPASSAGVTVAILGTKFTAISDSTGTFTFDSVPAGYYSFQFSKPGFTTYVQSTVPFIGSGTLEESVNGQLVRINNWKTTLSIPTVLKIPYSGVDSLFQFNFPSGIEVFDSSGQTFNPGQCILYFSKSPTINYMDTSTYFSYSYANGGPYILYPNSPSTYPHDGDTVYAVGYPVSNCYSDQYQYTYYVGDTLKTGYAGNGPPSNTVKVVLP